MVFLVEETADGQRAYESLLVNQPQLLNAISNSTALRILKELSEEPMCVMDLARKIREHEQRVYYHARKLEKLGLIKVVRTEARGGALAKIYSPISSVVSFKLFEKTPIKDVRSRAAEVKFLKPFIQDGRLNSIIVVGSPDPHGRYKAPASDGYCAIDLCLFLGQFLNTLTIPCYKLDTQIRGDDLERNMLIIGGPKANIISDRINKVLPVYFDYSDELLEWSIVSSISKTTYREKHIGAIARVPSPFHEGREVLVLAGKGFRGTKASVLAFVKHVKDVMKGNSINPNVIAKVVQGIDLDSDGIVDEVEFIE